LILENLIKEFKERNISFTCIKLNDTTDKMIDIMKKYHSDIEVTDLSKATQTKTAEEVTKMFVDSASYILRATVEKKKGKKSVDKSTKKPLWDLSKLEISDYFSCISYLKVEKIEGNQITVKNYNGGKWLISKDLLERDMWSGEHFE